MRPLVRATVGGCLYCGRKGVKLTTDHANPKDLGGRDDDTNYVLACGRCNKAKGNQPFFEFLATCPENSPIFRAYPSLLEAKRAGMPLSQEGITVAQIVKRFYPPRKKSKKKTRGFDWDRLGKKPQAN